MYCLCLCVFNLCKWYYIVDLIVYFFHLACVFKTPYITVAQLDISILPAPPCYDT